MNRTQNKNHRIETNEEINKIYLSCFDCKIYIFDNKTHALALGH